MELLNNNFAGEMRKQVQHDKKYNVLRSFVKLFNTDGSENTELYGNFACKMLKQVQHDKKLIFERDDFFLLNNIKLCGFCVKLLTTEGSESTELNGNIGWQLCL